MAYFTAFTLLFYLCYKYYLYKLLENNINPLIIFSVLLFIYSYILIEIIREDRDIVYLLTIDLVDHGEKGNPDIKFECSKMDTYYWEHVKKEGVVEPIEVQDGKLYIVNKIVVNKFSEVIGVIT